MIFNAKNVLGALCYKHDGEWDKVYKALASKEELTEEEIRNYNEKITTDYIYVTHKDYPRFFLNELNCPPVVIFYKGDLSLLTNRENHRYLGIVGTRENSEYGAKSVRSIVRELPKDFVIVSGLAKGIDREAHEAALDYGLKTIAVLGNGIDYVYPSENEWLYKRIIDEGGLIISEYPSSLKPKPDHFLFRNRIVASIAQFLLIGEAYDRSGSSVTVNYALQAGKTVGCIPYPRNVKSLCNKLIREGATLIESAADILDEIGRK